MNASTAAAAETATSMVVIGASWGGMEALPLLLDHLDPPFSAAVVIALHRHPRSDDRILVSMLGGSSALPVHDVGDKDPIHAGHVYVAPPDYHLLVDGDVFSLSVDEPVHFARPSVDVLFESAAAVYGSRLTAVVLTGANDDGAAGVACVRARGGRIFVQDPATAVRPEMPNAALATGPTDGVGDPSWIGSRLSRVGRSATPGAEVP